jgi:hypothetical protein
MSISNIFRPSTWGMKLVDVLFILFVVAALTKWLAPTSGLSIVFQQLFHGLAIVVQWLANVLVTVLNWI